MMHKLVYPQTRMKNIHAREAEAGPGKLMLTLYLENVFYSV